VFRSVWLALTGANRLKTMSCKRDGGEEAECGSASERRTGEGGVAPFRLLAHMRRRNQIRLKQLLEPPKYPNVSRFHTLDVKTA
jgi:hypothetical protein